MVLSFLHRTTKTFICCASLKKSYSRVLAEVLQTHSLLAEYLKSCLFKTHFHSLFLHEAAAYLQSFSLCQWLTHMLCTGWCSSSLTWTNPFPTILHLHLGYSGFLFKWWLFFFMFHVVKYAAVPVCCTLNDLQRSLYMKQKLCESWTQNSASCLPIDWPIVKSGPKLKTVKASCCLLQIMYMLFLVYLHFESKA